MLISYEVSLYPNDSVNAEVRVWEILKTAYWAGETYFRSAFVRYCHEDIGREARWPNISRRGH